MVVLLDGRDCSVENLILKQFAELAFCDAKKTSEIHERVYNEAFAVIVWDTLNLTSGILRKFKALKLIVRIGSNIENIDIITAGQLSMISDKIDLPF